MAEMSERDRRVLANIVEKLARDSTPDGDALAALATLRKMAGKLGLGVADLMGGNSAAVEEVTRERNALRRRVATLERANAARIAGANAARAEEARRTAREVWRHVADFRRSNPRATSTEIAAELTRRKVPTPKGGAEWSRMQVHRLAEWLGYHL